MRKAIVVLVLSLFLLAACQQTRDERVQINYRSGSQGLVLRFLPNLPPMRLYDDQEFNVVVEVLNAGASPAGKAGDRVYLSGFDPTILTGVSTFGADIPPSEGKTLYNMQGTQSYVDFKGIPQRLRAKKIDRYPFTLLATSCYNYKTIASENVCVDADPFAPTAKEKVCSSQPITFGTQGAPIAVTKVDVEPSPGRTRFTIYVSNVGAGAVFRPGLNYLQKCSPYDAKGLGFGEVDMVRVNDIQVSGLSILASCRPLDEGNLLRLYNGRGQIVCELRSPRTNPAYFTPIVVDVEYGYRTTIATPVELITSE